MMGALTWQVKYLIKILLFVLERRWYGDFCPALLSLCLVFSPSHLYSLSLDRFQTSWQTVVYVSEILV
ncbi:hypothetical protein A4A49_07377 [Nicotiana attenuata]|uniref:Uncharacterized protein n=1 Tax=Nicotiana attenuata TaxID=49451 RepID=A0A1J6HWU9_NICAT|nr:hypothetical protein A4A49_07377 [Nicotiana attenuata]